MKNFCLYNGKKIVKPDIWNITSIELSVDYTSAIIQAESKSNKSEYNLDVTPLISNQYKNGIDPYSSTIVNSLTGVSDWVLDSDNNQIVYTEPSITWYYVSAYGQDIGGYTLQDACDAVAKKRWSPLNVEGTWNVSSKSCAISGEKYETLPYGFSNIAETEPEEKTLPLPVVAQQVISNANAGDTQAQQVIISAFNNTTDGILTSDYSEFFEQNKQPK